MRGAHLVQLVSLTVLSLVLALPCLAQSSPESPLSNSDVTKMLKAGIPEGIIIRKIQMSETNFHTGPSALIELKKQGASENILGAVLDTRSTISNYAPTPSIDPYTQPSTSQRAHRLPSFEADLRLNSSQHEKISMGKNQIKLVQSGVPVFTLQWKENASK